MRLNTTSLLSLALTAAACGAPTDDTTEETAAAAGARPNFQLPFRCGQTWEASTYSGHWPDSDSIDLGRWSGDTNISEGEPVLASAGGTVLQIFTADVVVSPPHGNAIYIDHGGGWVTHYLHLRDEPTVAAGDLIARGQQIGVVGNTGTEEFHLHYTQLADGNAVRIAFNGTLIGTHAGNFNAWGNGEALTSGDSDGDGTCDSEDLCAGSANNADWDHDGIGDACDTCPQTASLDNGDGDHDGVGDVCDTCPGTADSTNLDTDGDGNGDVCDNDDDGDGCSDATDQHPKDDQVRIGTELHPNCSPSSGPHYATESGDTDGDHIRDCADNDDDNDGIVDASDPCPRVAGNLCVFPGRSCPLSPIFFTCRGGGCNEQLLRVEQLINPDPTTTMYFDIVSVVGDEILVAPLSGRNVTDSAQALRASLTLPSGRRPSGALRMEVVNKSGRVLVDVATYVPSTVRVGRTTGTQLVVKLPASGVIELSGR